MRTRLAILTGISAAILTVTGCTLQPTGSPATSVPPSPTPSRNASPSAEPVPTTEPPQSASPTPSPSPTPAPDPQAPPAEWSNEELVGACKEAWVASGAVIDWSVYSPDATIEARGSEWYVAFAASDGSKDLECLVSGTPTNASVTTLS